MASGHTRLRMHGGREGPPRLGAGKTGTERKQRGLAGLTRGAAPA